MSKTVPSTPTLPNLAKYMPGEDITIADWQTLIEAMHYHYAHLGSQIPGMVFDTPWNTTSTTYTSASGASPAYYDLDDWNGHFRFLRRMYDSADDQFSITLDAYAQNLDVRATLVRIDAANGTTNTSTTFTLTASTSSGDSEWVSADLVFTTAQQAIGGSGTTPAYFLVYVEAKVPSAGTGYLWSFALRETVLTGAQLPRS